MEAKTSDTKDDKSHCKAEEITSIIDETHVENLKWDKIDEELMKLTEEPNDTLTKEDEKTKFDTLKEKELLADEACETTELDDLVLRKSESNNIIDKAPVDAAGSSKDVDKFKSVDLKSDDSFAKKSGIELVVEESEMLEDEKPCKTESDETSSTAMEQTLKDCKKDNAKFVRCDSETPEEIIKLLKNLSPEKLQAIKSKVFSNDEDLVEEKAPHPSKSEEIEMEIDSVEEAIASKEEPVDETTIREPKKQVGAECVILLDSDEESDSAKELAKLPDTKENNDLPVVLSSVEKEIEIPQAMSLKSKRKSEEILEENSLKKIIKKECINPNCARDTQNFVVSPQLILNFYYVAKKSGSIQYVCDSCSDKAFLKYEELGEALLNNKPMCEVPLHKKHEMVEVIDSDDEDEKKDETLIVPEDEKIDWNLDIELEAETLLQQICNRVDLNQQLKWDQEDLEMRSNRLDQEQKEIENELRILEMKSNKMYNDLYAINKPRIERRPSLDITHEAREQPQMSLRGLLAQQTIEKGFQVKFTSKNSASQQLNRAFNPASLNVPTKFSPNMLPEPGKKIVISPSFLASPTQSQQIRPDLMKSQIFYAVRSRIVGRMQTWAPCKLLKTNGSIPRTKDGSSIYKVQFFDSQPNSITNVTGKEFATSKINRTLKIGARVIAIFSRPGAKNREGTKKYLPGVIGEKLSKYNKHRYLVFCDYGQVQYSSPESVREIVESSPNVWEDVHENLRQFIYDYLQSQTMRQRALLNVRPAQRVPTERNGKWNTATVVEIDCSLVKMHFSDENFSEWLYRGSKRLGPLYSQGHRGIATNARRNDPNISYITIDDDEEDQSATGESTEQSENKKNTARKSTAPQQRVQQQLQRPPPVQAAPSANAPPIVILNDNNIYLEEPKKITKFRHFTPRKDIAAKRYEAHSCSASCLPHQSSLVMYSPLSKPLLSCWERQIVRQKQNRWVQYKAPCGRRLRNMHEIRAYLNLTNCLLNVDNFDFDVSIQVLHAYDVIDKNLCPLYIPDMSEGKEGMKIQVINAFDDTRPPALEYSAVRIPMKGVHIKTDPEFLACCDCTDDCADKAKCACFQMTIQGMKYASRGENLDDDSISYEWRRLLKQVSTGIYECNSQCKCTSRCLNKVVQNPIQVKMQLYRTKNRGWGLECCHDIPNGTFICIYAGRLYMEDEANALCQGQEHGDEYFAELDLIETATPFKEGFEQGVVYQDSESEEEEEEKGSDSDSDYDERKAREDEEFSMNQKANRRREIVTRSARGDRPRLSENQETMKSDNSDSDGEMVNMLPSGGKDSGAPPKPSRLFRKLYGKNEKVYIMDAKLCGNVGRYFNHSCDPNLIVQSVFVDTHDMRFPWIAFFATRAIKAGEELTWNYNYDVGSVASKCLYCKCGAKNCRGRIL